MPTRGDRHLRAVQLAKQLAALGARLKTIHLITGIPPRQRCHVAPSVSWCCSSSTTSDSPIFVSQ